MRIRKMIAAGAVVLAGMFTLTACNEDDANVASENLSKAADNFEVARRIVFYNGVTGEYMLVIQGLCSLNDQGNQLEVTCKTGTNKYKKHFLGLSDNVTYFAEQMDDVNVSVNYYRVTFKPQTLIPDIDVRGGAELPANQ